MAGVEAHGATAWHCGRARHDTLRQLRAGRDSVAAQLTWGRRRPRRPVAAALSARRGMEGALIGMRCRMRATGNRV
jgi:hypothetical protein